MELTLWAFYLAEKLKPELLSGLKRKIDNNNENSNEETEDDCKVKKKKK